MRAIEERGAEEFELIACANDTAHFINSWAWTFDPREMLTVPFILFPRQVELVRWIEGREAIGERGFIEKSRDTGATWTCAAVAVHHFLFRPGANVGFGSRKLEYVDKLGVLDSILEKCRFILRHLPSWMLPGNWSETCAGFCKLVNPQNGNTITGEAGSDIGRGGRCRMFFLDEAAWVEQPERIEASLSATTNCRIDLSTHNGMNSLFARNIAKKRFPVFRLFWRDDPRKDQAYYDKYLADYGPVVTAQELDCAPIPGTGLMFRREWFEIVDTFPPGCELVRAWDKAATKKGGDFSAGVLMTRSKEGVYFVAHALAGQWSVAERNTIIKQMASLDTSANGPGVKFWFEQEPGSGGKESAEYTIKELAGYSVFAEPSTGSKEVRAQPLASQASIGNVKLVRGAWNGDFLDQLCVFPHGVHDDFVDAAALAFNRLCLTVNHGDVYASSNDQTMVANVLRRLDQTRSADEEEDKDREEGDGGFAGEMERMKF